MRWRMLISKVAKFVANLYSRRFRLWQHKSVALQQMVFTNLIKKGKATAFGREHDFKSIKNHHDFCQRVPIRDYEEFKPYINRIINGERSILWPGYPKYFAKTSGTTSGVKYIPITSASMPNHITSARLALIMYIYKTGNTEFINGKYMFISGSPELEKFGRIASGRLSGIVNHHVPSYIKVNQMPTYTTNCISDWETKLDSIVEETKNKRMTLISGIPPWVEMYFNRIIKETGKKTVGEVFPHFSLFVYGGVNFKPYERRFREIIGRDISSIETFPASEGFFAFQDEFPSKGLLLIPDSGIFYEFVPVDKFDDPIPPRLTINDIELDVNYALVVSTNAGLWANSVGDTVKFVSKNPYRVIVTGRLSHFTSAFGEHVIADEVESSINEACAKFNTMLTEFTVAPLVHNPNGLPCHEWFVEFSRKPDNLLHFQEYLDSLMQQKNPYYKDLIKGKILQPLIVRQLQSGAFVKYMKSIGKLGGQNKVPHLKNDRSIAEELIKNSLVI
jgi:hypothetical protein